MYAQATASIRDFNMIVAPFPLHGRYIQPLGRRAIACAFTPHLQTCCHRQFPNWSQVWACRQDVVPSGGIVGGLIGAIEGATGPHIPMQGGAISRALLQRGCICPLTHWQLHPACTCELNAHKAKATMTRILIDTPFSKVPKNKCRDKRKMTTTATRHQQTLGPSPSGSRRLSIARSMAECALAITADCSAMSLFAMAICARRTASCVRLGRSCIATPSDCR